MYFKDGKPIALQNGMVIDEVQIVLPISAERMEELGITERPDEPRPDDRYYWVIDNGDGTFEAIPKDIDDLKENMVLEIKKIAAGRLAPSDWKIVRDVEGIKPCDQATRDYRAAIRSASNLFESAILSAADVPALEALEFPWPEAQQ